MLPDHLIRPTSDGEIAGEGRSATSGRPTHLFSSGAMGRGQPVRHGYAESLPPADRRPMGHWSVWVKPANPPAQDFLALVIPPASVVIPATTTATATAGASEIGARGTSFINGQRPALELLSIQAGDGPLHILTIAQLNKAEAARRACHLVTNHHG